jgi:hypothetical protein
MTRDVRDQFNALGISRPEKAFISYPSPPILFKKMDEVQRQAFRTLTGKGLVDLAKLENNIVSPSSAGRELFLSRFLPLFSEKEKKIAQFIAESFANNRHEISELRQNTGLRRVIR